VARVAVNCTEEENNIRFRAVPASACVSDGATVVADLSHACLSSSFTRLVRPVNCWAWITEACSSGACGYDAMATEINGGFFAAGGPRQHRGGLGCDRCFQVLHPAVFFSPRIARSTSPCCCFFLLSCPLVCSLESGWQQSTFFAALLCCTRKNLSVPWIVMLQLRVFLAQQSPGVDGAVVVGCSCSIHADVWDGACFLQKLRANTQSNIVVGDRRHRPLLLPICGRRRGRARGAESRRGVAGVP
jgi:hypothetical protein